MNFGFTPEQEALREDVRQFIAENLTPEVIAEMEGGESEGFGVNRRAGRGPRAAPDGPCGAPGCWLDRSWHRGVCLDRTRRPGRQRARGCHAASRTV